jgi:hypothetical protein
LAADYYKMILNTTDEQPGKNIYLDNFKILYGTMGGWETILYGKSDGFVSELDMKTIYANVDATNKGDIEHFVGFLGKGMPHSEITEDRTSRKKITIYVNKKGD